jgi:exodeoxyribonuclease V alpha subunit
MAGGPALIPAIALASLSRQLRGRKPCSRPRVRGGENTPHGQEAKAGSERLGRMHQSPPLPVAVTGQSPSPDAPQSLSVLETVLERITYVNEDTGYTIARVATERTGPDLLTVVGPLLGAQVGESLRLTGRWSSHPTYGRQFQVHSYTTVLPATIQGIRRYLGSGLIKGIGPAMAERMVAYFGIGILGVIETEPGRLVEGQGLGPKRTKRIAEAWEEQKAIKEVMVFLSGVGVSTWQCGSTRNTPTPPSRS